MILTNHSTLHCCSPNMKHNTSIATWIIILWWLPKREQSAVSTTSELFSITNRGDSFGSKLWSWSNIYFLFFSCLRRTSASLPLTALCNHKLPSHCCNGQSPDSITHLKTHQSIRVRHLRQHYYEGEKNKNIKRVTGKSKSRLVPTDGDTAVLLKLS